MLSPIHLVVKSHNEQMLLHINGRLIPVRRDFIVVLVKKYHFVNYRNSKRINTYHNRVLRDPTRPGPTTGKLPKKIYSKCLKGAADEFVRPGRAGSRRTLL